MKREIVFGLCLLMGFYLAPSALALSLEHVPLEELINESDVIVVGPLVNAWEYDARPIWEKLQAFFKGLFRGHSQPGYAYTLKGEGDIVVKETLLGKAKKGEILRLVWTYNRMIAGGEIFRHENTESNRIWLLKKGKENRTYVTGYPYRERKLEDKNDVIHLLPNSPYRLRFNRNQSNHLTIVYKNTGSKERKFPLIEYDAAAQQLRIDPRLDLQVWRHTHINPQKTLLNPKPGSIQKFEKERWIVVTPGAEYKIPIDLRRFYDFKKRVHYTIRMVLDGHGPWNAVKFYGAN